MADNVNITPGSGAVIAADDVGGVAYQLIKLALGGNGAADFAPGDATYGLDVDVTRVGGHVSTTPKAGETWPISAAAAIPVSDNASSLTVDAPAASPVAVRLSDGSAFIAGLPVSGTVTVEQGTAAAASSGWPVKLTNGTDIVGITDVGGAKAIKVDVIQSVEGSASSADLATLGNITPIAGLYNESATDPTSGQAGAVRITAERGLHINLRNASGAEVGLSAAPLYIAAAASPGTFPVSGTITANLKDASNAAFSATNPLPVLVTGTGRTRVTKTATLTASQTAVDLWTPAAGKKFVITKVIVAITGAGTLTLFDGTNTAANNVFAGTQATGNREYNFIDPFPSAAINTVLRWTTGTGTAGELTVHGYEE